MPYRTLQSRLDQLKFLGGLVDRLPTTDHGATPLPRHSQDTERMTDGTEEDGLPDVPMPIDATEQGEINPSELTRPKGHLVHGRRQATAFSRDTMLILKGILKFLETHERSIADLHRAYRLAKAAAFVVLLVVGYAVCAASSFTQLALLAWAIWG